MAPMRLEYAARLLYSVQWGGGVCEMHAGEIWFTRSLWKFLASPWLCVQQELCVPVLLYSPVPSGGYRLSSCCPETAMH